MPQLTRQELYDLVWTKPMRDVAASIPMSNVGLKKAVHPLPDPRSAAGVLEQGAGWSSRSESTASVFNAQRLIADPA